MKILSQMKILSLLPLSIVIGAFVPRLEWDITIYDVYENASCSVTIDNRMMFNYGEMMFDLEILDHEVLSVYLYGMKAYAQIGQEWEEMKNNLSLPPICKILVTPDTFPTPQGDRHTIITALRQGNHPYFLVRLHRGDLLKCRSVSLGKGVHTRTDTFMGAITVLCVTLWEAFHPQ